MLNDSKYGYCLDGSTLTATLIRSSYDPDPLPEQGKLEMKFALMPHGNKISVGELMQAGADFNQPLQVVATDIHKGRFASIAADIIKCDKPNVIVTGMKKAEDHDALIVRLLETAGKAVTAKIAIDPTMIGEFSNATEVDLMERDLPINTAKKIAGGFSVTIPANAIANVKIELKP